MKIAYYLPVVLFSCFVHSCTPIRGCTESTADNFDVKAEDDDGTCIPSRDKIIGEYTYSSFWTDIVSGQDFFVLGDVQITEAHLAANSFNANFDGSLILQGSISQNNISITNRTIETSTYSGIGNWVSPDTVDVVFNVTLTDPILPAAQQFVFYCKKTQ